MQLPLDSDASRPGHPELVRYWQRVGDRVGEEVAAIPPPPGAHGVKVRAVGVRPAIVTSISERDVNIVVERLTGEPPPAFDLIVATNILVY
jgi:hypothetical protein